MVRIIVALILLAGSVSSQTSPRLDSISVAVREQINAASSFSVLRSINRAYQQVCTDYPAYEIVDTLLIDSANGFVSATSDFDRVATLDLLSEEDGKNLKVPLMWLDMLPIDSQAFYVRAEMDKTNPIDQKFYRIFSGDLYTYPRWTRDDTASFEIRYYGIAPALSDDTNTVRVASKYLNAVFWLACADLQARRGQPGESAFYLSLMLQLYGPPRSKAVESSK